MMRDFIFINDQPLIDRLCEVAPKDEFRHNAIKANDGGCFKESGWLIYEPWLMKYAEFRDSVKEIRNRNLYETGDPEVSYDDLCRYQKEFEEKYGQCDGFSLDSDVMAYHFALVQYCIDRAHNVN